MKPLAAQIGSAAVAGGSGILGSVINYFSQKETNKANLQLAKQQNDWNVEQWERENAYNSPQNQVQMLRDAGLNPAVYNQNSTASNIQSADLANQQAPQMDLATPVQSGLSALQTTAQMEALRAQIAESKLRQDQAREAFPGQLQAIALQNLVLRAQEAFTNQQTKNAKQQAWLDIFNFPYDIESKRLNNKIFGMQPDVIRQNIKESNQRITASEEQIKQAWQDLRLKAHLQQWQIKQMRAEIAGINANTNLLQFRAQMAKKYNIDPNLPALNNLISLSLSSPDQFNQVTQSLITNLKGLYNTGATLIDPLTGLNMFGFGFRNPTHFLPGNGGGGSY